MFVSVKYLLFLYCSQTECKFTEIMALIMIWDLRVCIYVYEICVFLVLLLLSLSNLQFYCLNSLFTHQCMYTPPKQWDCFTENGKVPYYQTYAPDKHIVSSNININVPMSI